MNVKTDILSEYLLLMKTKKALGIHKWVYEYTTEEYRERGDTIYTFKSFIFEIIVIFRNYVGMSTFI